MEATCAQRALFRTPDGMSVVFIALPTAPDQPMPYLLVQVFDVKPARRRKGGRAQILFTFNTVDVGGLDRAFIEKNISNNPQAAWRALNPPDDAPAPRSLPAPRRAFDDGLPASVAMTPRGTAAAQRL